MKTADLYIRVSTDEQADKGYFQRDQEERLRKYCELNTIQIRQVIFEDHSAKTFERPRWKQLLNSLRSCLNLVEKAIECGLKVREFISYEEAVTYP